MFFEGRLRNQVCILQDGWSNPFWAKSYVGYVHVHYVSKVFSCLMDLLFC